MKLRFNKLVHNYKNESDLNIVIKDDNIISIDICGLLGKNKYSINNKYLKFKNGKQNSNIIKLINSKVLFFLKKELLMPFLKRIIENFYGVNYGWKIKLTIKGRGFKIFVKNNYIYFDLGFSHGLKFLLPSNVYSGVLKKDFEYELILIGCDKVLLSNIAFNIRSLLPINSYKARGFIYSYETFLLKSGKKWIR